MNSIVKTTAIPFLSKSRSSNNELHPESEVLHAGDEELAKVSEATLSRLRSRVKKIVNQCADNVTGANVIDEAVEVSDERVPVEQPENSDETGSDRISAAIDRVVELVCERSGPAAPTLLLFVGSEHNSHVDEMSARVSAELCNRTNSRVLLIDSDTETKNLTQAARQHEEYGITEVIERNHEWRDTILRNENSNLDFIPCGGAQFGRWNQKELMRKAVVQMKANYQFICVAGGDAHSRAAKLWADVCDGSYLLVSVKNSNGSVAKSAVAELQSGGARLLGCIATDVDS